jgi:branched-chain amino acid transport system substrate-binding protein
MQFKYAIKALHAVLTFLLLMARADAEESIRIGLLLDMSGPHQEIGRRMENAARLYVKQNGERVAGKKIEIIVRDTAGPTPDLAKRLAQELVLQQKVDFLAGFAFTPNAMAAAQIATAARKPMIVMGAATSSIPSKSPYVTRLSLTMPQVVIPLAQWAAKNGVKKVFTLVSDYGPGLDSEAAFLKGFADAGGQIVGSVRVPLANPDFAPFLQRVKDAKPDAVFVFLPTGEPIVSFMKGFAERELGKAGIRILSTTGWGDDDMLELVGDAALGTISTGTYSTVHDSALNREFLAAYAQHYRKPLPNFMSVAAYDGMALIYDVIRKLNGNVDGEKAMQIIKGMKLDSPRGRIAIDSDTRDIVQTVYVRRVEKVDGKLRNVEFARFENVKDQKLPAR